jgi:hypothetical protein
MRHTGKGTTKPGYENRNGQVVVRCTEQRGTDHLQFVYVLNCKHCGHVYGVNGTDIHARKCPAHQGGRPGLPITPAIVRSIPGESAFVCPLPSIWNDIYSQLCQVANSKGIERPPIPLILNGWVMSSDLEKMARWKDTLTWAAKHGLSSEIPELSRDQGHYFGD